MTVRRGAMTALLLFLLAFAAATSAEARTVKVGEFKLSAKRMKALRTDWVNRIQAHYPKGSWAPMKFNLSNRDLRLMGLPSKRVLLSHHYRTPTAAYSNGKLVRLGARKRPSGSASAAAAPGLVTFAGTGFFGIRPGAWLLFINEQQGSVGWCSAAHVYGSPGAYQISTAGHCGNAGDTVTMIGALSDKTFLGAPVPVLMDIGTFSSSTGDAGIGKDWALISVASQYQNLVTPTMAFWGGPIGMYTATGEVVGLDTTTGNVSVNPNPTLVQQIVHYGHGAGVGAGGTPRSGTAINWRPTYFTFFGVITPGDSGSGSNTLTGDTVGANREAAGINTHIYVDGSMKTGLGLMAGTRATLVNGTLANGQILPYPAPTPVPLP
jgi:hypothetical protein